MLGGQGEGLAERKGNSLGGAASRGTEMNVRAEAPQVRERGKGSLNCYTEGLLYSISVDVRQYERDYEAEPELPLTANEPNCALAPMENLDALSLKA